MEKLHLIFGFLLCTSLNENFHALRGVHTNNRAPRERGRGGGHPRESGTGLPGDDGQVRRVHAGPHEEHHVLVPRLPVVHHLLFEQLQVVLVVAIHLQQADGHLAVPAAAVHPAPAALPDGLAQLHLLEGDVPLLQVHAGLAGLARDGALPGPAGARQVIQLVLVVFDLRPAGLGLFSLEGEEEGIEGAGDPGAGGEQRGLGSGSLGSSRSSAGLAVDSRQVTSHHTASMSQSTDYGTWPFFPLMFQDPPMSDI